jgi:hypothetical protein
LERWQPDPIAIVQQRKKAMSKASLTISRASSTTGPDTIYFQVTDEVSRSVILQLEMSPEQFALALTGLAVRPASAEWCVENLGKRREVKEEVVPFSGYSNSSDEEKARALAPFEINGWCARRSDLGNHHRIDAANPAGYRVVFTRFVEPDEEAMP